MASKRAQPRPPTARRKTRPKPRTTCVHCGEDLPPIAVQHNDPYCSTSCAREGYQTTETRKKLT